MHQAVFFLSEYRKEILRLVDSGEYDDELVNELSIHFVSEYRKYLGGLPYPLVYLGSDEIKMNDFSKQIFEISQQVRTDRNSL